MLTIDQTKCKQDGLCAADCPTAVIHLKDQESYPEFVPGGEQLCLRCGHCVAACPHGALSHVEVPLSACPPLHKELAIRHEQAVQFLRSRRSIRRFQKKTVEKKVLQELIEIARYAPTGSNTQLVNWIVFDDREKIHRIAEETVNWMRLVLEKDPQPASLPYMPMIVAAWDMKMDVVLRNAPALVVACAPRKDSNGMVNLTLALSYLELAAPGLGLGTCWAGLLQGALLSHQPVRDLVGIPEDHPHHYPMMVGFPKVQYYRLPERRQPRIDWR